MSAVFVTGGSGFVGGGLLPALAGAGHRVVALARTQTAAAQVASRGAHPVSGDLTDQAALTVAMTGCDAVVHAAGRMHGGHPNDYRRDNVVGTRTVLAAAKAAGVGRFVFIGAAGSLVGGRPIIDADETSPLHEPRYSPYLATKTVADRDVRAANTTGFATCVVRPGWVWGEGDPFLDAITAAARAGKMMLIDHGKHPMVASHRDNAVHAVLLALALGAGGEAYYIFDDGAVTTREFLTALLDARGLPAPVRSIPYPVARSVATATEAARRLTHRPGEAQISRLLVEFNGRPFVVSDAKARSELGYRPVITRDEGLLHIRQHNKRPQAPEVR